MVLVMSLWDDHDVNMLWLDSDYQPILSHPAVLLGLEVRVLLALESLMMLRTSILMRVLLTLMSNMDVWFYLSDVNNNSLFLKIN